MELTKSAQELLGFITSHLERDGTWCMKRAEVEEALKVSSATLTRALAELKRVGLLEVVEEGGGAGRPTRYRLKLPQTEQVKAAGEGARPATVKQPPPSAPTRPKPAQVEHVHEHVQPDLAAGEEMGKLLGEALAGFLKGLWASIVAEPKWVQVVGGAVLGASGGLLVAWLRGVEEVKAVLKSVVVGAGLLAFIAALLPSKKTQPVGQLYSPWPSAPIIPVFPSYFR